MYERTQSAPHLAGRFTSKTGNGNRKETDEPLYSGSRLQRAPLLSGNPESFKFRLLRILWILGRKGNRNLVRAEILEHGKAKPASRAQKPLNAAKSRPWSFVPNHEPVLWKDWFFVPTLRVQVVRSWNRSRIKSGMTVSIALGVVMVQTLVFTKPLT